MAASPEACLHQLLNPLASFVPFNHCSSLPSEPTPKALLLLLQHPIAFVPATYLTLEDEERMAPELRPRRVNRANETAAQRQRRILVEPPSAV